MSGELEALFRGEVPSGATVYLENIHELPLDHQRRLGEYIRPEGGGSEVTWAMHGPSTFFTKLLHTVLSMDKMVGTDFANGLANLKQLAEM